MAIEEDVSKSASPPSYPEMIMEAIEALKQKDGSDKSSISEYIESKYEEIASDHENVLDANLTCMKENGELLLVNNNYLKASPDAAPVKRGRGRPPKPKDPLAPALAPVSAPAPAPAGSSRGRGRPRKDPNAPPAAKKAKTSVGPSSSGRPRGRPRKVAVEA